MALQYSDMQNEYKGMEKYILGLNEYQQHIE